MLPTNHTTAALDIFGRDVLLRFACGPAFAQRLNSATARSLKALRERNRMEPDANPNGHSENEPTNRIGRSAMKINFVDQEFLSNCRVLRNCQGPLKINLRGTEISVRNFRPLRMERYLYKRLFEELGRGR